jgi:phage terminase large subunit GpA-like protein
MPRPRTTPPEWAQKHREYPKTSGHPGKRNPYLTPYMIAPVMAAHARTHKRIVVVVSAQSGKTESILDLIAERLYSSACPIIYVGPSRQFLTEQLEPRVQDLMDNTPLRGLCAPASQQKKTRKTINGVPLRLAHGGSSGALKSDPFGLACTDEADELMANVRNQGSPITLVDARGDSYPDFVHMITSTPSVGPAEVELDPESGFEFWADSDPEEVKSTIWRLWLSGSRYHWAWPCPHCEEYFIPRFTCLAWDKPKGEDGRELPSTSSMALSTAHLVCPRCGTAIYEDEVRPGTNMSNKEWMNSRGDFVAPGQKIDPDGTKHGTPPDSWTLSYWISGLASPFVTWGERAARYVEAVRSGDQNEVQTVKNAGFGELYAPGSGNVPLWAEVKECAGAYRFGETPDGVRVQTLAVDVQQNRLVIGRRGWGAGGTSWLLEAADLFGATEGKEVWNKLGEMVSETYDGMPIKMCFVDSGFRPGKKFLVPVHRVYEFARKHFHNVRATKGSSVPLRKPITPSQIDVIIGGQEFKNGLELIRLDTDHWKSWVQQRVRWDAETGSWFLPEDISDDYCKQIVSEARIVAPGGKVRWVPRSKENHHLDVEAMQGAIASYLGLSRLREGPPLLQRNAAAPAHPPSPPGQPGGSGSAWGASQGSIWGNNRGSIW